MIELGNPSREFTTRNRILEHHYSNGSTRFVPQKLIDNIWVNIENNISSSMITMEEAENAIKEDNINNPYIVKGIVHKIDKYGNLKSSDNYLPN